VTIGAYAAAEKPKLLPSVVDQAHFAVLRSIAWKPYGAEGVMPVSWADLVLNKWKGFNPPLPARRQSRTDLRAYCQNPATPPMHAFIAVMAWGVKMPRSWKFREAVLTNQDFICGTLAAVRKGGIRRAEAYDRWKGRVWGLGPSFFSKLLAFMCPDDSMAIMDQWTVKAVNLLYQSEVVRLASTKPGVQTSPCNSNTGQDYERYCLHLKDLQCRLGEASLSATEERVFSRLGEGTWRAYVVEHWQPVARRFVH
jgi:hypothetical protein